MLVSHLVLPLLLFMQGGKLEITDKTVGKGEEVRVGDVVGVEYTGTLTTGKQFDSNKGKEPFTFQVGVGQVIEGWDQGLVGMHVGGERSLNIPAELAYGDQANGDIPAKSALHFEVKLL